MVRSALLSSGALIREVTGQGPEKTLSRGFALVRDQFGYPITRADRTASGASIEIQFCDGKLAAIAGQQL
jgi:exodeoxyribonuclease VII large subunit